MSRVRHLSAAMLVVIGLAGCSGEPPVADAPPAAEETPTSAPPFEIRPVVGERTVAVFDVSSSEILGNGPRVGTDDARSLAAISAIGDWLDTHLDSLQRGESGTLATVAVDPATLDVAAVTTALTSPEAPVAAAVYAISSYDDGGPEWLTAEVTITHPDDAITTTTMIFDLLDGDALRLILAGPDAAVDEEASR